MFAVGCTVKNGMNLFYEKRDSFMLTTMSPEKSKQTLLKVEGLQKYFSIRGGIFNKVVNQVKAVDDISFEVYAGEILSIVGESGCGKSTTGRSILRLDEPTNGKVMFDGQDFLALNKMQLRKKRKDIQVIFQDPFASLNPRHTVGKILTEALTIHNQMSKKDCIEYIIDLLEKVGLMPDAMNRYPHEFSGGQRQRIGIARAISVNPKLIICDEAVSALDVSMQAQVLNLLKDLKETLDLTYLFISHDLGVVRYFSDRIMVMYLGKIVEIADKKSLFSDPLHPYTKALLSAVPDATNKNQERILLKGDVPSPINPPKGCRFHTRCPFAIEKCKSENPKLTKIGPEHLVACHIVS